MQTQENSYISALSGQIFVTPVLITVLEISIMQWLEGKVAP
jgi:hypothetical protein